MLGRPVLLSIAAAVGSLLSVADASAGCYSCGCSTPVVYASPCATYAAPTYYYAAPPMYVVNQGPAYTLPVPVAAEPTPDYRYMGYRHRHHATYGATAYEAEEADEAPQVYPRAYRAQRYGYGLDYRYRHHGRPHIGMRHDRRFAHNPGMRMHMQHRMHMQMRMAPRLAPGSVHPKAKH